MDYKEIKDKSVALVLWNENDAHVYLGKINNENENYYFSNEIKNWKIQLDSDQLNGLAEVKTELKNTLLNADLYFNLTVSALPDDFVNKDLNSTGLKWHE